MKSKIHLPTACFDYIRAAMENSLNSSSPEATTSGLKSVFKKPANFYQAFEVSMDESVTAAKINKSDADLDTTSSGNNKVQAFKKTRKSLQQPFNVTSNESLFNSESEQSVTFSKPRPVFSKKNKSIVDVFNVSYNETNVSSQADALSKTTDESNIIAKKKNPFEKANESQNGIVEDESSADISVGVTGKSGLEESQKQLVSSIDGDEADSTTFLTKQNPFTKSVKPKNDSLSQLHVSVTYENNSVGDKTTEPEIHSTTNNSKGNDNAESSIMKTRLNPFRQSSDQNTDTNISITKQRSHECSDNMILADTGQSSKNISLDKNVSKVANNTSYLEQSSINDDNLNNWMSDQSDEEMPPARIPSPTANLSKTKENPVSNSTSENPVSVWEQKFNEIVSNAEKKYQSVKLKKNLCPKSPTSPKRKPFQKSDQNVEKLPEDDKKYKPPKLVRPAPFVSKKLYQHIIKKLQPKYGIDTMIESENMILSICDTVKKVTRRKTHQKRIIQQLKKEMAEAGLIETTMDFYEFVIEYLPYSFRVKVVPCLQPVTNIVYPPKDVINPFDKIL